MRSCGTCKNRTKCKVIDVKVCSGNYYCNYAPEKTTSNIEYKQCRYNLDGCIHECTVECNNCKPKSYATWY